MAAARWLAAAAALGSVLWAEGAGKREAPSYSAASIVNAASSLPGPLAPYTLATIWGKDLARSNRALRAEDIRDNKLPEKLDGVSVLVDGIAAPLYFVSPEQINFLVPYTTGFAFPAEVNVVVAVDGTAGAAARVPLHEAAPALFMRDASTVIAVHNADWSLITPEAPAKPGETIVLFATGLGRTTPSIPYPQIFKEAAWIEARRREQFRVWLGADAIDSGRILYAGITPGNPGLYQINLELPEKLEKDPVIRISAGDAKSPDGPRLPCAPAAAPSAPQQ